MNKSNKESNIIYVFWVGVIILIYAIICILEIRFNADGLNWTLIDYLFKFMSYIVMPITATYCSYNIYKENVKHPKWFIGLIVAYILLSAILMFFSYFDGYEALEVIAKSFTVPIVVSSVVYIYKE